MVKQNLQSSFLDTSPPSLQVADLLNKATFPSNQHLSLKYWLWSSEWLNLSLGTKGLLQMLS